MTRTTSLIIGIAVVALVAVPSALGAYGLGDAPGTPPTQPDAVKLFYANERATVPYPTAVRDHGDAARAKLLVTTPTLDVIRDHGDATSAQLAQRSVPTVVHDHGNAAQAKLSLRSLDSSIGADKGSGRDMNWSQLGIGFGVGMLFVLGMILAGRVTRSQRLAH
jgi:hypothetical protein